MRRDGQWRDQRGQILPLFAFFLVMVFGIFAVSHQIGRLATRRIQLQTAADVGALAGARAQVLGLEFVATVNDFIEYHMGRILVDLGRLAGDPEDIADIIEDIINQIEAIEKCHKAQDSAYKVYNDGAFPVVAAAFLSGSYTENADLVFALPGPIKEVSAPKLSLFRYPWTWLLGGLQLREGVDIPFRSTKIEEKVTAVALRLNEKIDGGFLGFDIPAMTAWASAKPYWVLGGEFPLQPGEDPRDEKMNGFSSTVSMMVPGPLWSTRLVETEMSDEFETILKQAMAGIEEWVEGYLKDWAADKGKDELFGKIKDRLGEAVKNETEAYKGCAWK